MSSRFSGTVKADAFAVGPVGAEVEITASPAELNVLDGVTAGTATASKAVVLGASKEIATITSATITTLTSTSVVTAGLTIGATVVGSTATEINTRTDDSAMVDTIAAAGAVSVTTAATQIALVGAGAITLAVPTKPAFIKVLKMTVDNGDVTMALTNVVGGSAATTATFSAVDQTLVLVSDVASGKWVVLKEVGVVLS